MKSDILVSLIKEVVKTEVKRQVKEEIIKLIKSGDISLNGAKKISPISEIYKPKSKRTQPLSQMFKDELDNKVKPQTKTQVKEITKNPILNEILSQTTPFTAQQRAEAGPMLGATGGSILDALQPSVSMEGDWETMDYRGMEMPQQPMPVVESDNPAVDALTKALTRDYRELVKRF